MRPRIAIRAVATGPRAAAQIALWCWISSGVAPVLASANDPPTVHTPSTITVTTADAVLRATGSIEQSGKVPLSHRWDESFPGRAGRATYRIALPAVADAEPQALLFTRIGNQAVVRVNGEIVARYGELDDPRFDAAKTSWLVTVPSALLAGRSSSTLEIEVACQPGRWGGLSRVQFGPLGRLEPLYRGQRFWRFDIPVMVATGFGLLGLAALGLWRRQRVPLYGWFGLAAMLGMVRHVDRAWPDVPVPWPLWGALVAAAYAAHLVAMIRVTLEMFDLRSRALTIVMALTAAAACGAALVAFLADLPLLWSFGLAALTPYGLIAAALVTRAAWRLRRTPLGALMLAGMLLAAAAGLFDLLAVRLRLSPGSMFSTMPFAVFAIALVMAGLIVARYNAAVQAYQALNAELAQRIRDREAQLTAAFDALQQQQREQAVAEERQRLMREIHDGVGAQLVLLLNLASKGRAEPQVIEEQAKLALDEMRMAVDSLQPVHGDLGTVLATLRYRLLPRLEAAGLGMQWQMDRLPPLPELTPHAVLQVHRILLEAFTNVLRHARATTIRVDAHTVDAPKRAIVVALQDDGVGIADAALAGVASGGHGLRNMAARAQAIGARLHIARCAPRGTRIELVWELPPPGGTVP